MEKALFANVKKLYDHKMYECVIPAAGLLMTLLHNDRTLATAEVEYQVQLYLAGAQFKERQFRAALRTLQELIHLRSMMVGRKSTCGLVAIESAYAEFGDVEMRRRLAECYREIGDTRLAIGVLLQVPVKSRTPRINLMLARLQLHGTGTTTRNKAEALFAYKEVIRECPMALPVIREMLEMGVDGNEVNSLVMNAATVPHDIDWLSIYVKAFAQMLNCNHLDAARTFEQLSLVSSLRRNEHLMEATGKCYYYHGHFFQAEQYLGEALSSNPHNLETMGVLSVVLELRDHSMAKRDRLYARIESEHQLTANHLFIHAHRMLVTGKLERGLGFVARCLELEPRHPEALLLRGRLYTDMERYSEAVGAYREAQTIIPYRFEVFKGLFNCYLVQKRYTEAQAMCSWTLRSFQSSARSYTMFGRTLFSSASIEVKKTARKFAQKAMKIDENYMPAVALMADVYELEGDTKACLKLLEQHTTCFPHEDLFVQMGNIQQKEKQPIKALEYYYKALGMNPKCQSALLGINSLKGSGTTLELIALVGGGDGGGGADIKRSTSMENQLSSGSTPNSDWVRPIALTDCIDSASSPPPLPSREPLFPNSPVARSQSGRDNDEPSELDTTSERMWHDVDVDMVNLNTSV